jgi:hypothetical protein
VLDFSYKFCYYYIVPRGERIALLLHKNQSRVREILKKISKNPLTTSKSCARIRMFPVRDGLL